MMFALFKLSGGILCFFCNAFLTVYAESIDDVVKDFVAVQIVSQVDDLMASTVTTDDSVDILKLYISNKRMRRTDIQIFNLFVRGHTNEEAIERSEETGEFHKPFSPFKQFLLLLFLVVYRLTSIIYHVFYFYFAPFFVTAIVIYSQALDSGR